MLLAANFRLPGAGLPPLPLVLDLGPWVIGLTTLPPMLPPDCPAVLGSIVTPLLELGFMLTPVSPVSDWDDSELWDPDPDTRLCDLDLLRSASVPGGE